MSEGTKLVDVLIVCFGESDPVSTVLQRALLCPLATFIGRDLAVRKPFVCSAGTLPTVISKAALLVGDGFVACC